MKQPFLAWTIHVRLRLRLKRLAEKSLEFGRAYRKVYSGYFSIISGDSLHVLILTKFVTGCIDNINKIKIDQSENEHDFLNSTKA